MAELVEFNLEQCLPFFNGLKPHIDDDKLKELVRKRRHFEYKICSKNKEIEAFKSYLKHELGVLEYITNLKIPDIKILINYQKNLIERIIKQMSIHFQSQPSVFLLATNVMRKMKRTSSEKFYWEELLTKHGCKNVKFYAAACNNTMHKILNIINEKNARKTKFQLKKLNEKLKLAKKNNIIKKINKLEKEQATLEKESIKAREMDYINHMEWTRLRFFDGFNEFADDKLLFKEYLLFEILNRDFFLKTSQEEIEGARGVRDGRLIEFILTKMLGLFDDVNFFKNIIEIMRHYAHGFESDALEQMIEFVRNAPIVETITENCAATVSMEVEIDEYASFIEKYGDVKSVRSKIPAVVGKELHAFLQILKTKMLNNEVNRSEEMVKLRKSIEWVLNDDDWASVALDLWWDYYDIEKNCGDIMKADLILQNASRKLKDEFQFKLNLRKLKSKMQ